MAKLTSTPILVKIGQKMWLLEQVEISQKEGVCVKMGYDRQIWGLARPLPPSVAAPTRVTNQIQRPLATRGFLQIEKRPFQSKVMAPESLRILKFAVNRRTLAAPYNRQKGVGYY